MCTIGCTECRAHYENGKPESVDNSHGLCPKCLRLSLLGTFRKQQRKENLPDCAGQCFGNCATTWCTYWPVCVKEFPTWADFQEVERRLADRRKALCGKSCGYQHHEVMAMASAAG